MPKDDSLTDQKILEAIQSYQGVPSGRNLSIEKGGPLGCGNTLISERIKGNPALAQALEDRGVAFVESCDRAKFDECIRAGQWASVTGKVRQAIDKRLDGHILEAIRSYDGVPNTYNLSKPGKGPLEYSRGPIGERIEKNPELQQALETRGIWYVEACDRKTFDECITTKQWNCVSEKIREAINKRLDACILEAILPYEGIPTGFGLGKDGGGQLEYGHKTIAERLEKNPELQQALEARGIQFVETCDRKVFDECVSTGKWVQATGKTEEAIRKRLDANILEAIQSHQGIPSAYTLNKKGLGPLEHSDKLIGERIEKNPELQQALEARGVHFVETCDRKTFDECITTRQWAAVTGKTREAIDERLDACIFEAILSYEGIPSAFSLSKEGEGPLEFSRHIIGERFEKNPELERALEARGIQFVDTCDRKKFDECFTTGLLTWASGKTREAVYKRLDANILEAIQSHPGVPNAHNLSNIGGGPLECGVHSIIERLKNNPELRKALYLKRGLTEDRINALEIEQEDHSPALAESIRRRLPNTRIFREALGILRQFRGLFEGKSVIEASFYPEPLGRAAQMLGIQISPDYARAHMLKRSAFRFEAESKFEALALLQVCHRLGQDALINAFNEANRILVEGGIAIVSLPDEFSRTRAFEDQIQDFGFELKAEGTLYTRTLGLEEIASLGIQDPERLKQKIEQATNIILLVKTMPAIGSQIDGFVPQKQTNGNGEFIPSMEEIDTPESLLLELSAVFRSKTPGLNEAFILTVLDDLKYEESHVVGYDMNPKEPKVVESYSKNCSVLASDELCALPARILEPTFRERVLVRAGHETKIPARLVRNALK